MNYPDYPPPHPFRHSKWFAPVTATFLLLIWTGIVFLFGAALGIEYQRSLYPYGHKTESGLLVDQTSQQEGTL